MCQSDRLKIYVKRLNSVDDSGITDSFGSREHCGRGFEVMEEGVIFLDLGAPDDDEGPTD